MSIAVRDLTVVRGQRRIIHGLNLAVPRHSIHAIVGGNGTGKSTLVAALAGDLPITAGEVLLDDASITALSDAEQARRRSVLPQHVPALAHTPWDLLELAAPALMPTEIEDVLDRYALAALAHRSMLTLSGGERARALLAMTIARDTATLVLDEPTAAFDRAFRQRFTEWVREWRDQGRAIVIVTHDQEIEALADQVTEIA